MAVVFITGIDTGIGKTVATGLLGRFLLKKGIRAITQKMVQTGSHGISGDIIIHRKIMGMELTGEDRDGTTSPYNLSFPASPHLSAKMEAIAIDPAVISRATKSLETKYGVVLLEGAGGIFVPLNGDMAIIDYVDLMKYPVIIVTTSRLGSINHTLMTMKTVLGRGLEIAGLIYNTYPAVTREIEEDSADVISSFMKQWGIQGPLVKIPGLEQDYKNCPDLDFSGIFTGDFFGAEK